LVTRLCLAFVALTALLSLTLSLIPSLGKVLPGGWRFMNADNGLCVLLSAVSLHLSDRHRTKAARPLSLVLAALVALSAAAVLLESRFQVPLGIGFLYGPSAPSWLSAGISPLTPAGFLLLGMATFLLQLRNRFAGLLTDLLIFLLGLLVLVVGSEYLFGVLPFFYLSNNIGTSPLTLLCLFLLAQVALFRRAEHGVFSILLGRGIGSRIARLLSPIMLVVPFLREAARVRIVNASRLPPNFTTAILASLAAIVAFVLLLSIGWLISGMEREIHDLSLRDELTGLYNLRGFHLLAEQALRMAQRSLVPFSVLFIDLDSLKKINDAYGHDVGSSTLREAAELIQATFRETDVLARIGGDEFAAAGQFSDETISVAADRLRKASALRNTRFGNRPTLSFSMGHVTTDLSRHESLKSLLSKADDAMYEEKRSKKSASN
jgi:diguanylate cyclase (GGDEF)-like protein